MQKGLKGKKGEVSSQCLKLLERNVQDRKEG